MITSISLTEPSGASITSDTRLSFILAIVGIYSRKSCKNASHARYTI
jgi:hypothetical protein